MHRIHIIHRNFKQFLVKFFLFFLVFHILFDENFSSTTEKSYFLNLYLSVSWAKNSRDVGDSFFLDFNVSKYFHFTRGLGEGMMVGGGHQRLFQVGETQERWQRSLKISL